MDGIQEIDELVLEDNQLVCVLTNKVVKATDKELTLQSMIDMMAEEYGFAPEDMERDFRVTYQEPDSEKSRAQSVDLAIFNEGQSMIDMMAEEYGFAPEDMERDFRVTYQEPDSEKSRAQSVDLAIFNEGKAHEVENLIRFVVVAKDAKVKPTDAKKGAEAMLDNILTFTDCEFGCWTNGEDLLYRYYTEDDFGQADVQDISDFPANGQTLADLEAQGDRAMPRKPANESLIKTFKRCHDYIYGNEGMKKTAFWELLNLILEAQGDRAMPRKPANESLIKTFKRCHDYIYGNEGMKKTAFWELLNLIFCKLYDEKRRNADAKEGISYRRRFWVGVTEQFTEEGRKAVATRVRGLFEELKDSQMFRDVFDGSEQIMLSDRGLAFVAAELAKYSFLDATVDVKGTAYETVVSNTLKQEAGQFFTPRNIIKCMVEMLDPNEDTRVLDPACGSGGFLVSQMFRDVFDGSEQIMLSDRGLAFVAAELAKYSFLDATVDVKGTAYETIVSNTLKQEAGQFFTPRNIIKCMVEMLDPNEDTRVLDPACGSGGFLVMVLDHVRRKITRNLYPDLDEVRLAARINSPEVDERVRHYAESLSAWWKCSTPTRTPVYSTRHVVRVASWLWYSTMCAAKSHAIFTQIWTKCAWLPVSIHLKWMKECVIMPSA